MFWDFLSLRPETTHQVSFLFSDRGIPDGFRHMNGYGSHTFKLVNADGEAVYCKFHYKVYYCSAWAQCLYRIRKIKRLPFPSFRSLVLWNRMPVSASSPACIWF